MRRNLRETQRGLGVRTARDGKGAPDLPSTNAELKRGVCLCVCTHVCARVLVCECVCVCTDVALKANQGGNIKKQR